MGAHKSTSTTAVDIAYGRAPLAAYDRILAAVARWNVIEAAGENRTARDLIKDAERNERRGQTWRASEARGKAAAHAANAVRHRLNAAECETVLAEMGVEREAA